MSVPISFTIPGPDAAKLKERIREESMRRGISMSEWLVEAIAEYLRSQTKA